MSTPAPPSRGWPRCSFVAEAAGDPLPGNAPPARSWFLVEHPGPWDPRGFLRSGLRTEAVVALSQWAAAQGGRVLLVRRPGRRDVGPRRWFRVDSRPGRESIRSGLFHDDHELVAATTAPGEPHPGPLALVCTHGRHDTCCAVRGRPLAAALAAAEPAGTWECSHIGGCRFAPALVLLPHGYVLGGVAPDDGPQVIGEYREGRLDPRLVRGRSSLAPAVQAAEHEARLRTGARGVDALRVVAVESDGPLARVRFTDPPCTVTVTERRVVTDRPLTCAATAAGWLRIFDPL